MFVDRHSEIDFLNSLLTKTRPTTGQLLLLYGRRRVGKTALLNYWAENSGANYTYWMASKEPPNLQRRSLVATIMASFELVEWYECDCWVVEKTSMFAD